MTPKEIADEIKRTVKEFQDANDARLKAVESGISTAVTSDKIEALNAKITELRAQQDELIKQVAHFELGSSGQKEDRETLAKEARMFFARKKGVPDEQVRDQDVDAYRAYAKAYPEYLRRGVVALNDPDIRAAMQVGSDPDGGYWVPTQRMNEIITRLYDTSPMRQHAEVISITTDSVTWPNATNDFTSGGFVGETESRAETATPQVGEQTIYVREQYAEPRATQKLLDMSTIDVEAWLAEGVSDIMTRTENARFVSGTGVKAPRGFLDYAAAAVTTSDASRAWGVLQYVPSGAAGAIPDASGIAGAKDLDFLITTISKLHPAFRAGAAWFMNRATEAEFRKCKDGQGRYLVGMGDIRDNAVGFGMLGYPIVNLEDMADIASNSYSVAFGNMRAAYQIVDGRGIRVLRDNLTLKGFVKFYTTKWTGGDVRNSQALKLIKFASS